LKGIDKMGWKCAECGERFPRPQGLGAHRRYSHNGNKGVEKTSHSGLGSLQNGASQSSIGPLVEVIGSNTGVLIEIRTIGNPIRRLKTIQVFGRDPKEVVSRIRAALEKALMGYRCPLIQSCSTAVL
jgi:hypothetical protein